MISLEYPLHWTANRGVKVFPPFASLADASFDKWGCKKCIYVDNSNREEVKICPGDASFVWLGILYDKPMYML